MNDNQMPEQDDQGCSNPHFDVTGTPSPYQPPPDEVAKGAGKQAVVISTTISTDTSQDSKTSKF